jgi:hypothetical protein
MRRRTSTTSSAMESPDGPAGVCPGLSIALNISCTPRTATEFRHPDRSIASKWLCNKHFYRKELSSIASIIPCVLIVWPQNRPRLVVFNMNTWPQPGRACLSPSSRGTHGGSARPHLPSPFERRSSGSPMADPDWGDAPRYAGMSAGVMIAETAAPLRGHGIRPLAGRPRRSRPACGGRGGFPSSLQAPG